MIEEDVIFAKTFAVVDDEGRMRITLSVVGDEPRIAIHDELGNVRAVLGLMCRTVKAGNGGGEVKIEDGYLHTP